MLTTVLLHSLLFTFKTFKKLTSKTLYCLNTKKNDNDDDDNVFGWFCGKSLILLKLIYIIFKTYNKIYTYIYIYFSYTCSLFSQYCLISVLITFIK